MLVPRRTIAGTLLAVSLAMPAGFAQPEKPTPVLLAVHDAPLPFTGSDGLVHLVYELWLTNFSSGSTSIEKVEVLGDGSVLQTLDDAAVAGRLQPVGQRQASGTMAKSSQALLFLHLALPTGSNVPERLSHRVTVRAEAAPPGHQELSIAGGAIEVDRSPVVVIGPPLRGERFVSADSCCDAVRHTRAALPVNERVWLAQRFAVDWEQTDESGRIYVGPREELKSYAIFGQPVLAVADAIVESTTDGLPEQTPGKYPAGISFADADGNSIILDLGERRYALYAHLQPGSIRVHRGDKVKRGQMMGLVGDSGNSLAPHLHFQVMDQPSSLAANGIPYAIEEFQITGKVPDTKAFDEAEGKGTQLPAASISPAQRVKDALPLDQLLISFSASH